MKKATLIMMITVMSLAAGYLAGYNAPRGSDRERVILRRDTVRDTVTTVKPICTERLVMEYRTVTVPVERVVRDTVTDSVRVELAQEHKKYTDDSTYIAYVSGVLPTLDSITVFGYTVFETKEVVKMKRPRLSFGLQAGAGMTRDGVRPYLGIGVQFNLINLK